LWTLVLAERGVSVQTIRGVVVYSGGYAIDADGDPHAYDPTNRNGDDWIGNAGKPGNWFGVETDTDKSTGTPVRQLATDPCPGFFVPTTALADHSITNLRDPRRYVDGRTVRYISIPHDLLHAPVGLGDVAVVCYRGKTCAAIVADVGPRGKYGEGSPALGRDLGFANYSPKNGGVNDGVTTAIFPEPRARPRGHARTKTSSDKRCFSFRRGMRWGRSAFESCRAYLGRRCTRKRLKHILDLMKLRDRGEDQKNNQIHGVHPVQTDPDESTVHFRV
jgi:hypothetical protein